MPQPDYCSRFEYGGRCTDLHEDYDGCSDSYGSRGMQYDAEWAMVGIGLQGMHVRNLNNGQERQQNET